MLLGNRPLDPVTAESENSARSGVARFAAGCAKLNHTS
jgi:hypothetical protein